MPKPDLSEEERTALHNVTSGLCNRKQVKDVIEQAIMSTCIALRVPMPEKKGKIKGKDSKEKNDKGQKQGQADDMCAGDAREHEDQSQAEGKEDLKDLVLLKRRAEKREKSDGPEDDEDAEDSDGEVFEGFSDSEAEERAFSRYDDLLGGTSSDEDDPEDGVSGKEDSDLQDSRDRLIRKVSATAADDDISVSSAEESEEEESSDDAEPVSPPPKKAKMKPARAEPVKAGQSALLPTLMGGYISGSESASDVDVGPAAKKNRRGQRARQAIWEKKYGEKAKHKLKQTDNRDRGWDMQRGAVGDDGDIAKPWKKGIQNPFEKTLIHPERMRHIENGHQQQASNRSQNEDTHQRPTPKPPKPEPRRDDTGTLHPSWAAAKKAKEEGQKVAFQGRKVVFD